DVVCAIGSWFMMVDCFYFFFFFSSRRRHTRLVSDWSSDVCSSDLSGLRHRERPDRKRVAGTWNRWRRTASCPRPRALPRMSRHEIGRASCRERVEISVGGGAVKKKRKEGRGGRGRGRAEDEAWTTE